MSKTSCILPDCLPTRIRVVDEEVDSAGPVHVNGHAIGGNSSLAKLQYITEQSLDVFLGQGGYNLKDQCHEILT